MHNLTCDENHIWRAGGVIVPGVTQILDDMGCTDYSNVPPAIMASSQKFGKAVHLATELDDMQDLDMDSLDIALLPYVEAWRKFKSERNVKIVAVEKAVYHPVYRYAGRLDRLLLVDGRLTVADIKSSSTIIPATDLQTAAYAEAEKQENGLKELARLGVQLKADGNYKMTAYANRNAGALFLAAASLWHWRNNNRLIKGGSNGERKNIYAGSAGC